MVFVGKNIKRRYDMIHHKKIMLVIFALFVLLDIPIAEEEDVFATSSLIDGFSYDTNTQTLWLLECQ